MREILRALVLLCVATFLWVGTARADENAHYDLSADWLDGSNTLDATHVQRLIDIAQQDPDAASVVANAENVLGVSTADQLLAYVRICQKNETEAASAISGVPVVGLADVQAYRHIVGKSVAELVGQYMPDHDAELARQLKPKEKIQDTVDGPDYVTAYTILRGDICIAQDSNLALAYETFIHELTHIAKLAPKVDDDTFLSDYPSADDYVSAKLVQPGGEFEANYEGYRAAIRLAHSRVGLPQAVQDSFDDQGKLVDRQKFIDFLLNDAGYDAALRQNYREEIFDLYGILVKRENFLVATYNDRLPDRGPNYAPNVQEAAAASDDRLASEITQVRALEQQYRDRMTSEGIASFGTSNP